MLLLQQPNPNILVEQAQQMNGASDGYTFALSACVLIIITLLYVCRVLWKGSNEKDIRYIALTQTVTKLLTEVNIKMDEQQKIQQNVFDIMNELKDQKNLMETCIEKIKELKK